MRAVPSRDLLVMAVRLAGLRNELEGKPHPLHSALDDLCRSLSHRVDHFHIHNGMTVKPRRKLGMTDRFKGAIGSLGQNFYFYRSKDRSTQGLPHAFSLQRQMVLVDHVFKPGHVGIFSGRSSDIQ